MGEIQLVGEWMSKDELAKRATELALDPSGKKAALVERINAALQAKPEGSTKPPVEAEATDKAPEVGADASAPVEAKTEEKKTEAPQDKVTPPVTAKPEVKKTKMYRYTPKKNQTMDLAGWIVPKTGLLTENRIPELDGLLHNFLNRTEE